MTFLQPPERVTCADDCLRYDPRGGRGGSGLCHAAPHPYSPVATLPMRCVSFNPKRGAEDQRTGAERWPALVGRPGQPTFVVNR